MKRLFALTIVTLFGLFACIDLLHPGFPVTHDGQDHVARIANFYQNVTEGNIIPRWAGNLNWGYGHPILEFLYPLPSYIASLFHFLGFSLIDSVKLVFALGVIASGLAMYLFLETAWGILPGLVGGILYMYAPYRFVDLYVRGDIGEHIAFIFIPFVCWGFYKLFQTGKGRYVLFSSAVFALLILSHNAISLMILPVLLGYALYLWWQKKWEKEFLIKLSLSFLLGFLLASFFWVPALFEGQFTLRNIVIKGQYVSRFVSFGQLLSGTWNYGGSGIFTMQLGVLPWLFFVLSLLFIFGNIKTMTKNPQVVFLGGLCFFTFLSIFLMLPISNFLWAIILLLQNFQFPWRFLAIPVFTTSVMGAWVVTKIPDKQKLLAIGIMLSLLIFLEKDFLHAKSYVVKPESFFTGIYDSSTDTGESAPIWSVRFMEHGFDKSLVAVSGSATIIQEKRKTTDHRYIVSSTANVRLLENTLYFPGWKVLVDGTNIPIQFQDPAYRGLMTFIIPPGTHTVRVVYSESKLRLFGDILSLVGVMLFGLLWIVSRKRKNL